MAIMPSNRFLNDLARKLRITTLIGTKKKFHAGKVVTTLKLQDLGKVSPELAGILSPGYENQLISRYIHSQFLENAEDSIERYKNTEGWLRALKNAQQHFSHNSISKILDIGSGGGNTLFPLMDMYPKAFFVASDLSVQMLKGLRRYYQKYYGDRSCIIVQLNAEELIFENNQFDLVVGGAILHHLYDPAKTIAMCYKILKPGCTAVFFEPFEIGNQIIGLIIQYILDMNECSHNKTNSLPLEVVDFFRMLRHDFETRKGTDKSTEKFKDVDDKWLFTRGYVEDVSMRAGFKQAIIYPIHTLDNMFFDEIKGLLRVGLQADVEILPNWAVDHIHQMDEYFSKQVRQELLIAGCIILIK